MERREEKVWIEGAVRTGEPAQTAVSGRIRPGWESATEEKVPQADDRRRAGGRRATGGRSNGSPESRSTRSKAGNVKSRHIFRSG